MMRRIAFDGLLVLSFVFLPWFVFVPLILLGCIFIANFYEGIFFGAVFDLLYGVSGGHTVPYVATVALGAFALGPFLRAHIRWYA